MVNNLAKNMLKWGAKNLKENMRTKNETKAIIERNT